MLFCFRLIGSASGVILFYEAHSHLSFDGTLFSKIYWGLSIFFFQGGILY
jgi:hypothetical protein